MEAAESNIEDANSAKWEIKRQGYFLNALE
jgi:hypothetical protein